MSKEAIKGYVWSGLWVIYLTFCAFIFMNIYFEKYTLAIAISLFGIFFGGGLSFLRLPQILFSDR